MNNEVRKPREAYLHIANDNYYTAEQFAEELKREPRMAKSYLHFKEILPGDDSLRHYDDVTCPFCNEKGFDLIGLKDHLRNYCEDYHEIKSIAEERIERESKG